ncbi:MAG: diadenylate cyclase CdaA [Oscillospiraceae bacterium]|nr:diadenylate cyclase CdaA [Oscillospiraceae bacterium]
MNILDSIQGLFKSIWSIFSTVSPIDLLDIVLLTFIVYKLIKIIRETRAGQLIKGIMLILVAYMLCDFLNIKTMKFILSAILSNGFIAIFIMFQPELRRALEKVGRTSMSKISFFSEHSSEYTAKWVRAIDEICDACEELSATTTGALIVIERQTKLGEQLSTGTIMNAVPSKELFGNIFYPKTPLHDGAVIMRDGMIIAAACFLPKPEREELINKKLGSRHRAAIGMSENSDAIIIVVSEETGTISIALNGELSRNYTSRSLKKFLTEEILSDVSEDPPKRTFRRKDNA